MNSSKTKIAVLLLLTLSFPYSVQAMADGRNAPGNAAKLQQSYVWYDGQQERQIWLDTGLVAEFPGTDSAAGSTVKSVYPDAVPVSARGAVRLWRLGAGVNSDAAASALKRADQKGTYSPVLLDGPAATGRKRALPGNIIIYLDPAWNSGAIDAFVKKHRFEIVKKLEIGPNIYVIKTGPGLEALNTANALYKSGEVVAAFPDWWEEKTTR